MSNNNGQNQLPNNIVDKFMNKVKNVLDKAKKHPVWGAIITLLILIIAAITWLGGLIDATTAISGYVFPPTSTPTPTRIIMTVVNPTFTSTPTPDPCPKEQKNIMVGIAPFRDITEDGTVVEWKSGVARNLYNELSREINATTLVTDVGVLPPDCFPLITGTSAVERDQQADEIAQDKNVDILVYGTHVSVVKTDVFTPQFHIYQQYHGEIGEAIDPEHMGNTSTGFAPGFGLETTAKTNALIHFLVGLSYHQSDYPTKSIEFYQEAIRIVQEDEKIAPNEVFYLFLGTAYADTGDYDLAQEQYNTAKSINPDYARSYTGLGNIYYGKFCKEGKHDIALINQAIDYYEEADRASFKPESAFVQERIDYSLGNAYFVRGQVLTDTQEKKTCFENALQRYEKLDGERYVAAREYLGIEPNKQIEQLRNLQDFLLTGQNIMASVTPTTTVTVTPTITQPPNVQPTIGGIQPHIVLPTETVMQPHPVAPTPPVMQPHPITATPTETDIPSVIPTPSLILPDPVAPAQETQTAAASNGDVPKVSTGTPTPNATNTPSPNATEVVPTDTPTPDATDTPSPNATEVVPTDTPTPDATNTPSPTVIQPISVPAWW